MFRIPYTDHITNKEIMKRATFRPNHIIEIHPNEQMPVFRPRSESSKIKKNRIEFPSTCHNGLRLGTSRTVPKNISIAPSDILIIQSYWNDNK